MAKTGYPLLIARIKFVANDRPTRPELSDFEPCGLDNRKSGTDGRLKSLLRARLLTSLYPKESARGACREAHTLDPPLGW